MSDHVPKPFPFPTVPFVPAPKLPVPVMPTPGWTPTPFPPLPPPPTPFPTPAPAPSLTKGKLIDADAFIAESATNVPCWTWEGLIPASGIVMIAGVPFAGKTVLAVLLAMCSTVGRKLLGRDVMQGSVLYAKLEHHDRDFAQVLRLAKRAAGDPSLKETFFITKSLNLDDQDSMEAFKRSAEEVKAEVVIIDSLRRASRMDENSSQEASEIMARLQDLTNDGQRLVVVLHHLAKNSGTPRGSGDLLAGVDSFLAVTRFGEVVNIHATHHGGGETEIRLKLNFDNDTLTVTEVGSGAAGPKDVNDGKLRAIILDVCAKADQTRSGLRKAVRDIATKTMPGFELSNEAIDALVDKMSDEGLLKNFGTKHSHKWRTVPVATPAVPPVPAGG